MKYYTLVFYLLLSTAIFSETSNDFENITVGFKVSKPADWHFGTAAQNRENLKRVELNDKKFKEFMVKYSTAPLVIMTKYAIPYDDLNPSFKVSIKPFGNLKDTDAKQILWLFIPQFEKVFKDFKLDQKPMDAKIGGLKAAYLRIHYNLVIPDGTTFPTTSELWIVPRGDYFFMIGAGTRQDEKTGTRAEIKKILSSIVIQADK